MLSGSSMYSLRSQSAGYERENDTYKIKEKIVGIQIYNLLSKKRSFTDLLSFENIIIVKS